VSQTVELPVEAGAGRASGPPPDPLIGRVLLHYRVVEPIGQGGMSVVYRGRDEHLARDVAIKVLHPFLAEKVECRQRLAREARAVARLEHPHIVKVFDYSGERPTLDERPGHDEDDNASRRLHPAEGFIVAELVRGPTLKRFAERHGLSRCPELGALVVWQLLLALQHAHDNGIVHRDLKPENVMVRDDGVLKLMDFGIAQIADQGGLTITGTLLGSPAHMAPECIDGHPADERSDLFSMGTVLYWITTGSLPFDAASPHALLKQIVDGRAVPAQQRAPRVSDDLARVVQRSLATRPADRFGSAREFADALREVLERSGVVVDGQALTRALATPADALPAWTTRVRSAFLARATAALAEGATARALGALNRVLADDPADVDARALLDRVHDAGSSADDDTDGEGVGRPDTAAAFASTPATAGASPSLPAATSATPTSATPTPTIPATAATTPTTPPAPTSLLPQPAGPRWQSLLLVLAAVGMVALVVLVARIVDDVTGGRRFAVNDLAGQGAGNGSDDNGMPGRSDGADGDTVEVDSATENGAGENGDGVGGETLADQAGRDVPGSASGEPRRPAKVREPGRLPPQRALPLQVTPGTARVPDRRPVTFRINPWADIVIDGEVVARGQQVLTAGLTVGPHVVVFKNPRAKDHEVRLDVVAQGPDPVVTVRLEPRPALLAVRASEADALVDVGGTGGVRAGDTMTRPLVVPLEQSRQELEVFLFKKGFAAYRRRHVFTAGETLRLDVVLEPEAGDLPPTP
jgi:serine/threonine-protein kinase